MGGIYFFDIFFDASINSAKWLPANSTDITISQGSGELKYTVDATYSGSSNTATLTSVPTFNFTNKTVDVDLPSPSTNIGVFGVAPSGGTYLMIYDTNNSANNATIIVDQDALICRRSNNGSNSQDTTGNIAHTKWRINHNSSDNTWRFYTWNGSSWTLQFTSAAANWNPTSTKIQIGAYIYGTNQVNVVSRLDNLTSTAIW